MKLPWKHLAAGGLIAVLLCAGPPRVLADAVVLKNGTRMEGDVKRTATGWTVTGSDGKPVNIGADDVQTIEVGSSSKSTAANAAENLASLRRSAEALANPAQVIERYRRFLELNKGTPSIADARRDIAMWQDRLDRGLQKVGTQWVTPEEKAKLAGQAGALAAQAADLLRQGRAHDAEPLLQQALDADPANPAALYLRGVMLFTQEQIPAARKAFEAVSAAITDHAPTFNNLGVILWRQNQAIGALRFYDLGITAAPVNRILLDNVAEALAALPEDQRKNPIAVKLFKHFTDQDAILQTIMARQGLHRWGSTWVDGATLDRLKAAEKEIKDKLDKLAGDVDAARTRMGEIDKSIDDNTRSMQQMEATSYARDANNNLIRLALPGVYYSLQNDNAKLANERNSLEVKIQSLAETAKHVQQQMPVPQFSGVQHLIGAEGAPLSAKAAPATTTTRVATTEPIPTPQPVATTSPVATRPSGTRVLIPLP